MSGLVQDLRYALRRLRKSPGFTAVAVITLALGIGANTAIFSAVSAFLLRPLPFHNEQELVSVYESLEKEGLPQFAVAGPKYLDWRKEASVFQELGAISGNRQNLAGTGEPMLVTALQITPSYLRVLGIRAQLGRLFADDEDQAGKTQVVVLGHALWQQHFGASREVIGQTIRLDGKPHIVIGVLPPEQAFLEGKDLMFVPLSLEKLRDGPGVHHYQVIGRLKPGVSVAQSQTAMTTLADALRKKEPRYGDWGVRILSLREDLLGGWPDRKSILLLQSAVLIVLAVAIANVACLLLARSGSRRKEVAICLSLGAGRMRVISRLLQESLLLGLIGGVAGVGLATLGIRAANAWLAAQNFQLWTAIQLDVRVLLFCLALSLCTGVLFGLAPAVQLSRINLQGMLRSAARSVTGSAVHRRRLDALVAAEIGLALVLSLSAGLFVRNLVRLNARGPGFNAENVLAVTVSLTSDRYPEDARRNDFVERALERLHTVPGVRAAAVTDLVPMAGGSSWDLNIVGRRPEDRGGNGAQLRRISADYFRTMGMPVVRGRAFTPGDRAGAQSVAIINEALARVFFGKDNPIGAQAQTGDGIANPHVIVGVVKDERTFGLTQDPPPVIYVPTAQGWFKGASAGYPLSIVVQSGANPSSLVNPVRTALREIDPEMAFADVQPMTTYVAGTVFSERVGSFILASFSITALLLAALGVYAMMANAVSRRTNEIGIRMALGAQPGSILRLVIGRGAVVVSIGIAFGLAGAMASSKIIKSFLHAVSPTDSLTFAGVTLFLALVALLACYIPARRAAKVDPMVALRHE